MIDLLFVLVIVPLSLAICVAVTRSEARKAKTKPLFNSTTARL